MSQIFFFITLATAGFLLFTRIKEIRSNILLGRKQNLSDQPKKRWKTMLLIAFGQKKMFKRIIPAFLHLLVYIGFLVINLEVLEFVLDGILGTHRLFAPYLGKAYTVSINIFELLALGVLISCIVFLIRRFIVRIKRFTLKEMKGWPTLDATLILIIEIVLMLAIFTMNATDQLLQAQNTHYTPTGTFYISATLIPIFQGLKASNLLIIERFAWWFHIIGILGFAVYVTYSKHLHIFMAFPNTYFSNLNAKGKMSNMEEVTTEVKSMLGIQTADATTNTQTEIATLGAKDVKDLTWKNLMDAYACTECGRCTSECPANLTGKKLSPRKIMMDTRDRLEEAGKTLKKNKENDGKTLLNDYISKEEINACTTCNACVEACPININPLSIILQLRRYIAMEESGAPNEWNMMFSNIETSFSPWKFPPTDRFKWAEELKTKEQQ